jgi:hypothetical protein
MLLVSFSLIVKCYSIVYLFYAKVTGVWLLTVRMLRPKALVHEIPVSSAILGGTLLRNNKE